MLKRFIVKTLILFYLLSSYLHAAHIHGSHESHGENCKVCIVAKTFKSADVPSEPYAVTLFVVVRKYVDTLRLRVVTIPSKGYFSTAPPSI